MAIERIDLEKCIGCGRCRKLCSTDVIRMGEDGKPYIKYKEDCIVCLFCEWDCPVGAIYVSPEKSYKQMQAWD